MIFIIRSEYYSRDEAGYDKKKGVNCEHGKQIRQENNEFSLFSMSSFNV